SGSEWHWSSPRTRSSAAGASNCLRLPRGDEAEDLAPEEGGRAREAEAGDGQAVGCRAVPAHLRGQREVGRVLGAVEEHPHLAALPERLARPDAAARAPDVHDLAGDADLPAPQFDVTLHHEGPPQPPPL